LPPYVACVDPFAFVVVPMSCLLTFGSFELIAELPATGRHMLVSVGTPSRMYTARPLPSARTSSEPGGASTVINTPGATSVVTATGGGAAVSIVPFASCCFEHAAVSVRTATPIKSRPPIAHMA
jgi:hypothetical protein